MWQLGGDDGEVHRPRFFLRERTFMEITAEVMRRAQTHVEKWKNCSQRERQEYGQFWNSLAEVFLGDKSASFCNDPEYMKCQEDTGNGLLDIRYPKTKVLIEQKSGTVSLDKKNSVGETPLEQVYRSGKGGK